MIRTAAGKRISIERAFANVDEWLHRDVCGYMLRHGYQAVYDEYCARHSHAWAEKFVP